MQHLGILAHSVEGASLCFRAFAQEGFRGMGPLQHPDVTLDCIAMGYSMDAWEAGDYGTIRATLKESAHRLAAAGADFFICPDNTAHMALELPGRSLAIPGLHIGRVVASEAKRCGYSSVGILGTKFIMEGSIYPRSLKDKNIVAVTPGLSEHAWMNRLIFDELNNGMFTDEARQQYVRAIESLKVRGCDAVALVCTELPLLITSDVSPLPILDSTRLLAQAAFSVATGSRPLPSWRGGPIDPKVKTSK